MQYCVSDSLRRTVTFDFGEDFPLTIGLLDAIIYAIDVAQNGTDDANGDYIDRFPALQYTLDVIYRGITSGRRYLSVVCRDDRNFLQSERDTIIDIVNSTIKENS